MKKYAISEESIGVIDTIKGLAMNNEFLSEYEKEQIQDAMLEGIKDEAKQDGIIEGKQEEKLNIAKNLLKLDTPKDIIVKATGLTEEEINNL